jgi:cytochrome c
MKRALIVAGALGALSLFSAGVYAADGGDVVKAKGCLNCHAVDTKKVGPAYKDVAAKYKDNKSAEGDLVAKLKSGKGHPKVNASDDELKSAVEWVLSRK